MEKSVIDIAREIQAISQSGLTFTKDPFDRDRFNQLVEISAALVSRHTSHSEEYIKKVFSAETGYVTPKIDIRGAAFRNSKILLVRERESNCWTLPGGFVDINESPSESVEREVLEESGFSVKATKVAAIFDHRKNGYKSHLYHFYKVYMICDLVDGEAKASIETSEVGFFSVADIQNLDLDSGRVIRQHLLRMFDHLHDPLLPADFD